MKQLFIDVETTGVNHWQHSVHQISGIVVIDGERNESFDFNVRPHPKARIEEDALAICGKTREELFSYPEQSVIFPEFIHILDKFVDRYDKEDKFFFCAYNAHFDNAFIRAFFKQCGDDYFGSWFWSSNIDVMVLAAEYLKDKRHQMEDFKLKTAAKWCGVEFNENEAHDALYDVEKTKEIYDVLTKQFDHAKF